jgi:uncharacterized membrane protein
LRQLFSKYNSRDPKINYRGEATTRLDSLTDAVFGIAITLLIFNISEANSFNDLLLFAKSFPALLMSILFLILIWQEHVSFSLIYSTNSKPIRILNVFFITLVIFYIYPLKFLSRLLTNLFFNTNLKLNIEGNEIPQLMIFYGTVTFAIYGILYLFYISVLRQKQKYDFTEYEVLYTKFQSIRIIIMFSVPLLSVIISLIIFRYSIVWSSIIGGITYGLYPPLMTIWNKIFTKRKLSIQNNKANT